MVQGPFAPQKLPFPLRDYQLIGKIGKGAQASVYLARRDGDLGFKRMFAIRIVGTLEAGGGRELQMIANEANALAGIYHPNVVQVFDFDVDCATPYIVFEYVRGRNIREMLAENATVPETVLPFVGLPIVTVGGAETTTWAVAVTVAPSLLPLSIRSISAFTRRERPWIRTSGLPSRTKAA